MSPPAKPRRDYSRRPKDPYLTYPALVVDQGALEALGVIPGTRPEETPPKVIMTLSDWRKVVANPLLAKQALRFLGTGDQNPLKGLPADPTPGPGKTRPRRPGPFDHLRGLPLEQALARAEAEHAARLAAGAEPEASLATLVAALETVKRWHDNRVVPNPLPVPEGEEPPSPTELRRQLAGQ